MMSVVPGCRVALLGGVAEVGTDVLTYSGRVESAVGFCDDGVRDVESVLFCVLFCMKEKT